MEGGEVTDAGSCFLVHSTGTLRFGAGTTTTFRNGGFLDVRGGTVILEDNAKLVFETTASGANFRIDPGTVFKMGLNAQLVIQMPVTIAGTSAQPIRFQRLDPAKKWKDITLKADGNTFQYVVFDGGDKTVEVLSKNNTFKYTRFKNGWRGLSSGYATTGGRSSFKLEHSIVENNTSVGVFAFHSDPTLWYSTIRGSGEAGLYLEDAVVPSFYDILVTNNALTATTRAGVEVRSGGSFISPNYSASSLSDNVFHEIQVFAGATAMTLGINGTLNFAYNTVKDAANTGSEKYIHNAASLTAKAEKVYWGSASAPPSTGFYGTVTYGFHATVNAATGAGATESAVPSRMQEIALPVPLVASSMGASLVDHLVFATDTETIVSDSNGAMPSTGSATRTRPHWPRPTGRPSRSRSTGSSSS
jgi:hypothetical protein